MRYSGTNTVAAWGMPKVYDMESVEVSKYKDGRLQCWAFMEMQDMMKMTYHRHHLRRMQVKQNQFMWAGFNPAFLSGIGCERKKTCSTFSSIRIF